MNAVWISWERHRRSREIARSLDVPLVEMVPDAEGLVRYARLLVRTAVAIFRRRPTHVFVQCPSVILGLWVLLLKRVVGCAVIADLHNEAVEPFINDTRVHRWVVRRLHRHADLGLVSNPGLSAIVERNGGRAFVLPDRIPVLGESDARDGNEPPTVVFVCTFAPDEPYRDVFAAAAIAPVARIVVTGRPPDEVRPTALPDNVHLTGYLPDDAYEQLLRHADVIMDLTAMENCLVCGAYEAVALGKPLVTSDTQALRAHFARGTVFTRHDPESIAAAVRTALESRAALGREMKVLRADLQTDWQARSADLNDRLRYSRLA